MTDTSIRADSGAGAANQDDGGASAAAPTAPISPRPAWLSLTNCWRGLFTLSLGLTLCALAVAESTGAADAPAWFLGFAIPVLTEWIGEWVVWGRRREMR